MRLDFVLVRGPFLSGRGVDGALLVTTSRKLYMGEKPSDQRMRNSARSRAQINTGRYQVGINSSASGLLTLIVSPKICLDWAIVIALEAWTSSRHHNPYEAARAEASPLGSTAANPQESSRPTRAKVVTDARHKMLLSLI